MGRYELFVIAALLPSGCAYTRIDQIELFVASETVALDKRPWQDKSNLRPWEKGETVESDGTVSIVISNSCGFVDVTYRAQSLANYLSDAEPSLRNINVVDSMGEWCHVRHMIIDTDQLLLIRNWRGTRFVEGSARVLRDSLERPFIVDADFLENAGFERLVTTLRLEPPTSGCFNESELTPEVLEELRAEASLVKSSEGMCFERGIYLHALLTASPPSLEQ